MSRIPRWFAATLILGALALGSIGAWYYGTERRHLRRQATSTLRVIARWKADQVVAWRAELKADAALILVNRTFVERAAQLLASSDSGVPTMLEDRLRGIRLSQGYDAVRLVDRRGTVRASQGRPAVVLDPEDRRALDVALRGRTTELTNPHVSPGDTAAHLAVVAPLVTAAEERGVPPGAVLLVVSAPRVLSPLVTALPVPSRSAEVLLVRRDGDSVRFLTSRRFRGPAGLSAAEQLLRRELPAVQVVLGDTDLVEGVDYRGIPVLAVGGPVPDSPWFVVAKMDRYEALTVWRPRTALVVALLLGGAAALAALATIIWQRALRAGEAIFRVVFNRSTVGMSLTGVDGRLIRVNPALATMLGYTARELQALTFANVTHADDVAASREVIRSIVAGEQDICRFEKRYLHRDGSVVWADISSTLLRNRRGAPRLLITSIQNITERRHTEQRLRELEARHQSILSETPDIIMEVDAHQTYTWANPAGYEFFGHDVLGHEAADYFEGVQDTYAQVQPVFDGDPGLVYVESWQRRKDGERRLLAWRCHALVDGEGRPAGALSTARDITEQHRLEGRIQEQLDELQRWRGLMLGREERIQELKREVNDLCRRHAEAVRYPSQERVAERNVP